MSAVSRAYSVCQLLSSPRPALGASPLRTASWAYADDHDPEAVRSVEELHDNACQIAGFFASHRGRGTRALLALSPSPDFLACFFGCLYARVIAVPVPEWRSARERTRVAEIARECAPTWLIANQKPAAAAADLRVRIVTPRDMAGADRLDPEPSGGDDVAYLQFTSGSTGKPRGVIISHRNVLANLEAMSRRAGQPDTEWAVSWLPFYHDMGLISALYALYVGMSLALETPQRFIEQPWSWIQAISRFRACYSGGPGFAYELLNRAGAAPSAEMIDLSCWTTAFCGSEPIRPRTLRRFAQRMSVFGFRKEALTPGYGLAEFTLAATAVPPKRCPQFRVLTSNQQCFRGTTEIAECGEPLEGTIVRIVDPQSQCKLPDGKVGEIWLAGPSKSNGYWGHPNESAEVFEAVLGSERGYLRTGDLGFTESGRLFVVGRVKELLIVRGRNIHPQELEHAVCAAHPALNGIAAAFSIDLNEGEGVGIVCEVRRNCIRDLPTQEIFQAIQRQTVSRLGIRIDDLVLVRPGAVPRTTSGKIQRSLCRQRLSDQAFDSLARWRGRTKCQGHAVPHRFAEPLDHVAIANWVASWLAAHLGGDPDEIDPRISLSSFGLDSLRAVQLTYALEDWLGLTLHQTLIWRHPTLHSLSRSLENQLRSSVVSELDSRPSLSAADTVLERIENLSEVDVNIAIRVRGEP